MKCRDLTYEVGKTYTIDNIEMCRHGFHFCVDVQNVLSYYLYKEGVILLEVETMGKVITEGNKTVTDSLKVLRVVPKEEYTFKMPLYEYDERNNVISETDSDGFTWTYEYDERNNRISKTTPCGFKLTYEYDERNNKILEMTPGGYKRTWEYDDNNNMIFHKNTDNSWRIMIS